MRKNFQVYLKKLDLLGAIRLIFGVAVVFYIISLIITFLIIVFISVGNDFTEFCRSYGCLEVFLKKISPAWIFHWSAVQYIVAVSSVLGLLVAAASYISTSNLNKLNGHSLNVSSFNQRLASGHKKEYEFLGISDIDADKLYNLIYPKSVFGDIVPSEHFLDLLVDYNRSVDAIGPERLNDSLKRHLDFFIGFCDSIGVVNDYPKNLRAYLKIELEVVDFLNRLCSVIYGSRAVIINGRFLK